MALMLEQSSSLACPPRWTTRREPERRTLGGRVAEVAEMLGTPLMPWQRHVADVALELDPDTGRLVYREVVLTVPRQSGKTTLQLGVMVHRALGFGQRQKVTYSAQTRNDARKKWEDEHVTVLEGSPLRGLFTVRKSNGAEAIRWRNGSMHTVVAPTEKAGHGDVLDLGVIDEAFAQEDNRLEQAFKPAMVTRPQPQLWVVSTAGTVKSTYLREKVEAGRFHAEAGLTTGVAYFEWSAAPDADPADPATWWACMPALGHTVTEEAVRADYQSMPLVEFRRAYLNQWPDDAPDEWLVIGKQAWMALTDPYSDPVGKVAFAVDVNRDRTWASVGVAGRRADGMLHVDVAEHRPGTSWVVPWLVDRNAKWGPCALVIAPSSPAGSLIADAEAAGLEIVQPSVRDIAHGCAMFYDATGANPQVKDPPWLRHTNHPDLNMALAGARQRDLGDAWLWLRKNVLVDISPLVAVTLAAWGHATHAHIQESKPIPMGAWV
jgi:hypothetical protein